MSKVTFKSLSRNFLFAGIGEVWRISSRLILTPITIREVGLEGYGTWTLIFSLCAYGSMFNASFGFAYSKYTAEYDRKHDYEGLSHIIGSGLALVGGLGLVLLLGVWAVRIPVLAYFNVSPEAIGDAATAFALVVFCLLLRMSFGCTFDVLSGMQRADLNYKLNLLASFVEFSITVPLLLAGWGLLGLGIGYTSGQVVSTLVAWFLCKRVCPELHISPLRVSRTGLRLVTGLGGRFQALAFLNIAFDQGVKLLISRLMGLSAVGVYELAYKLLGLGTTISSSLLGPLMPAFANLHAGKGEEQTRRLFLGSSKLVALTSATALGFVAVFADQLVFAWTGERFPEAAWTLRVLAPTKFLVMLTGVPTASLRGRGNLGLEMWFAIIGTIGLVVSIFPLYAWAGYHGVIFSRIVEDLTGACWFLWAFFRREGMPIGGFVRDVFGKVLLSVAAAIGLVMLVRVSPSLGIGFSLPPRWEALVRSALWGLPFAATTWGVAWFLVLSRDEARALVANVRRRFQAAGGRADADADAS